MRRIRRTSWVAAAACVALLASCDRGRVPEHAANASTAPPAAAAGDRVESLPGVDVSQLTEHELETWRQLVNEQLSPCGEPMSVARCVADQHGCRACRPAARYLTRLVLEGYDKATIEEHFAGRFAKDKKAELSFEASKVRGSPMAPVTLVEFSDFQCPYCAAAHPELERIVRENEGRVKLAFKHYPLPSHARAAAAARAAEAAGKQGKFWEMHDVLFANQRALEDADLVRYARQVGLDVERFQADLASDAVAQAVQADRAEGEKLAIEGTPTLYVNGRRLREPFKALPAYLAEELEL